MNCVNRKADYPVISVIMGVYNCKETVSDAVDSILKQTFRDLELIICDDASTDGTYEELLRLQETDPDRIRLLRNETNSYLAHSLNRCLDVARGKYIARMDGDDKSYPERLEREISFLEAHPEINMVGTGIHMVMDWGGGRKMFSPERPNRDTMKRRMPFHHPTIVAKKEVFDALNGYAEGEATKRSEDIDLYCRFFLAGFQGANLQEVLFEKSETDAAMKGRNCRIRLSSYRTRIRCYKRMNYPASCYVRETLRLSKCLVPYRCLRWWRKVKQDRA